MLYDSSLWISDLNTVVDTLPELTDLTGSTVLITGAGGLICSAFVDLLIQYNERHKKTISILSAGRNEQKIKERFGKYFYKDYFSFIPYDSLSSVPMIDKKAEYIIHGAGNATPDAIIREPVETMKSNFLGLLSLLSYAKEVGTKKLLFISSSEIYGQKESNNPCQENEYGYVDLLNSRNSYSVGKRAAETLCVSFADEYDVDSVIIRPGHVYGPTAKENDNRVSSAWAYKAARGENIIMKSDGSQIRSYCYCLDNASAILKVLLFGEKCQAYNISNPDSIISIYEMAKILAASGNVQLDMRLPTAEERKSYNPMRNSSLNSSRLQALGWQGCFDAETGFSHTVNILKEIINKK